MGIDAALGIVSFFHVLAWILIARSMKIVATGEEGWFCPECGTEIREDRLEAICVACGTGSPFVRGMLHKLVFRARPWWFLYWIAASGLYLLAWGPFAAAMRAALVRRMVAKGHDPHAAQTWVDQAGVIPDAVDAPASFVAMCIAIACASALPWLVLVPRPYPRAAFMTMVTAASIGAAASALFLLT